MHSTLPNSIAGENKLIEKYLEDVCNIIGSIDIVKLKEIIRIIDTTRQNRKSIYTFGNGGSGATASHFAGDLVKGINCRAVCLNDLTPMITAYSNDYNYEDAFAMVLDRILEKDDIAFGISGSGESQNILRAIKVAKSKQANTIGLTAFNGGKLKNTVDMALIIPIFNMERAEDIHLMVCHIIKTYLGMV